MIEILVLIIFIIFVIYSIALVAKSLVLFIINIALIWVVFTRAFIDLKNKEFRVYYFVSAVFVIILFLLKDSFSLINFIFKFMTKAMVVSGVQIVLLIFLFANLVFLIGKWVKKTY